MVTIGYFNNQWKRKTNKQEVQRLKATPKTEKD